MQKILGTIPNIINRKKTAIVLLHVQFDDVKHGNQYDPMFFRKHMRICQLLESNKSKPVFLVEYSKNGKGNFDREIVSAAGKNAIILHHEHKNVSQLLNPLFKKEGITRVVLGGFDKYYCVLMNGQNIFKSKMEIITSYPILVGVPKNDDDRLAAQFYANYTSTMTIDELNNFVMKKR